MVYRSSRYSFRSTYRRPYRSTRSYGRSSLTRGAGTRFVARKYSRAVPGREVPYYLGPGTEAHVIDNVISHPYLIPSTVDTPSTVSQFTILNLIDRGTGIFQRESQRASMKYLLVRLRAALRTPTGGPPLTALVTAPITVRVMLVYATHAISTSTIGDFLSVPDPSIGYLTATMGVQRIDSRENFQILYDNKFVLRNTSANPGPGNLFHVEGDYTFKDLDLRVPIRRPVSFTAGSTSNITLSDITSGSLFLWTIVDGLFVTQEVCINLAVEGSARLVFAP